jgi:hypothetical protein
MFPDSAFPARALRGSIRGAARGGRAKMSTMRKERTKFREQSTPTSSLELSTRTTATSPSIAGGRTGVAGRTASELESFLTDAIARELGRRFGGNAVLDRLEAAALLARHVAFENESRERAEHDSPDECRCASTFTIPSIEQDSRR